MKHFICTGLMAVFAMAGSYGLAQADTVQAGGVATFDLSGQPNDDDDSGIIFWNQSAVAGSVSIEYLSQNPQGSADGEFLLLDGTLRVTIGGLAPGDYQMLIMREYSPAALRAYSRVRAIRVMRRVRRGNPIESRWIRAKLTEGRIRPVGVRAAPKTEMRARDTSLLGQHGYYPDKNYAWAVVDQASDFAVGADVVPEPSSLALLLGVGSSVFLLRRWR